MISRLKADGLIAKMRQLAEAEVDRHYTLFGISVTSSSVFRQKVHASGVVNRDKGLQECRIHIIALRGGVKIPNVV
jgi:hypothetical protein